MFVGIVVQRLSASNYWATIYSRLHLHQQVMMNGRSTRETIDDLLHLLQRFEQLDPARDDASVAALKRILRDRIVELEASVATHDK